MADKPDKYDDLTTLRKRHTDEMDVAISASESESWEQGRNSGRAAERDDIIAFLKGKGISSKIIEELQAEAADTADDVGPQPLTVQEYIGHALKTENIDFAGIRTRLESPQIWHLLRCALRSQVQLGMLMEGIKKHIFYGKPLPEGLVLDQWPLRQADAQMQEEQSLEQFRTPTLRFGDQRILRVLHALCGIVSEAGELAEPALKHAFGGAELDVSNLEEEVGDLLWYAAVFGDVLRAFNGNDLEGIMHGNVAKLKARYKGKSFDAKNAMERDTAAEDTAREAASKKE